MAKTDLAEEKAVSETRSTSQLERDTVDPGNSEETRSGSKSEIEGPLPLGFGFE